MILSALQCGTIATLIVEEDLEPFSGVKDDYYMAYMSCCYDEGRPDLTEENALDWMFVAVFVVDMPFSFVGDILVLPYSILDTKPETEEGTQNFRLKPGPSVSER